MLLWKSSIFIVSGMWKVFPAEVYIHRSLDWSRFKIALDYFFHIENEPLHLLEPLFNYIAINILMILIIIRWVSCWKASQWRIMNRSLDRSWFKVASDYFSMFRMGHLHLLQLSFNFFFFYSILNLYSLIAIHQN
jgi:hypothetical protein